MKRLLVTIMLIFTCLLAVPQQLVRQVEVPTGLYAFSFQEDKAGSVWVGLSNGDVSGALGIYSNSNLTIISGADSIPSGSYHSSIKLTDGSIIFGGSVLDKSGRMTLALISQMGVDTLRIPFRLFDPFINCMSVVNRREIWIGTASGLIKNNRGVWSKTTTFDGLPSNVVTSILQDFRAITWIATEGGIVWFSEGVLYVPDTGTRIIRSATSLFSDSKGYVWAGSRYGADGVSVYNGQLWDTFSGRHGLIDNSTSTFHQGEKGKLWVGSCSQRNRGGVSLFNGTNWETFDYPGYLAKPCVEAIVSDLNGNVWFGGSLSSGRAKGITIFNGKDWLKVSNTKLLPAERVIAFFVDSKERIWVSSFEGLFIIEPTNECIKKLTEF
jgi:ligand-binding sensor domain-containing protein